MSINILNFEQFINKQHQEEEIIYKNVMNFYILSN